MKEVKCIALIAHDNKKAEMVSWAMKNRDTLAPLRALRHGHDIQARRRSHRS